MHPGSSVMGMLVHEAGEAMLVWFNRLGEPVEAILPQENGLVFEMALVSCANEEAVMREESVTLPPRSVTVLKGNIDGNRTL